LFFVFLVFFASPSVRAGAHRDLFSLPLSFFFFRLLRMVFPFFSSCVPFIPDFCDRGIFPLLFAKKIKTQVAFLFVKHGKSSRFL